MRACKIKMDGYIWKWVPKLKKNSLILHLISIIIHYIAIFLFSNIKNQSDVKFRKQERLEILKPTRFQ